MISPNDRMINVVASGLSTEDCGWLMNELNLNFPKDESHEACARIVLQSIHQQSTAKNLARYKFYNASIRKETLKAIFNHCYNCNSAEVILAAEQIVPLEAPFYPRWKVVCWIQIPRLGEAIISGIATKALLMALAGIAFNRAGYGLYQVTTDFTKRLLPQIIDYTPIEVIRARDTVFNAVSCIRNFVLDNFFSLFLVCYSLEKVRKEILRGPQIPLITPVLKRVNFLELFKVATITPGSLALFMIFKTIRIFYDTLRTIRNLEGFLNGRVRRAEAEKDAVCKAKAFEVWMKIVCKNHQES